MYLSKRVKVVAGVSALLGLVMAGGAGFTATGLIDAAGTTQSVGGEITQTVTGGTTLDSVVYGYADTTPLTGSGGSYDTEINLVTLTFNDQLNVGSPVTMAFTGTDNAGAGTNGEYSGWTCTDITADLSDLGSTSVCRPPGSPDATYATNVESIAVDVHAVYSPPTPPPTS
jgi:hypothetical protein